MEKLFMSSELTKNFQHVVLGIAFQETKTKLSIFQSGQRRNSFNYASRLNDKQCKPKNIDVSENMLSPKILNEIQLDRLLEALISIYEVALEGLKCQKQDPKTPANWDTLCNLCTAQRKDEVELKKLLQELKQNEATFKELRLENDSRHKEAQQRWEKQDKQILSLRYNLRNLHRLNELELDLVQKWEENRFSQANIVADNAEMLIKRQIKHYQQLLKAEECRFRESQKCINLQMKNYATTIAVWQEKFVKKLANCQATLQKQELSIFDLKKVHETKRLIYQQRMEYVDKYLAQKAFEQQLIMQEMRRIESAVFIQAWWRGTMVRRGLGPFRKKSKKSKKAKSERK